MTKELVRETKLLQSENQTFLTSHMKLRWYGKPIHINIDKGTLYINQNALTGLEFLIFIIYSQKIYLRLCLKGKIYKSSSGIRTHNLQVTNYK